MAILDKITKADVDGHIAQAELLGDFSGILVPVEKVGDYQSMKPEFDKFSGSRARCFTTGMFRHTFGELAEAEAAARGVKLSKSDITNLFERLGQVLYTFFGQHPKGEVRMTYRSEYLTRLRQK